MESKKGQVGLIILAVIAVISLFAITGLIGSLIELFNKLSIFFYLGLIAILYFVFKRIWKDIKGK